MQQKLFNVVLYEPEIPQNTGNIGRTCVGTCSSLHLVGQLGFELSDRQLKRAGLDYWQHLDWHHHEHWQSFLSQVENPDRLFFLSKKASRSIYEVQFRRGDWLVFGCETKGLPETILEKFSAQTYKIPFPGQVRSFNLANAVAMILGEGLRQLT